MQKEVKRKGPIRKGLSEAIEETLIESLRCSQDNHGFIQGMPMVCIANLMNEYDKECRRHAIVPIRYRKGAQ